MGRLLVVGVRPNSLGWRVKNEAERQGWQVTCVDKDPGAVTGAYTADVTSPDDLDNLFRNLPMIDSVVYAAGVNWQETILEVAWRQVMAAHMAVNFAAPIELLQRWLSHGPQKNGRNSFVTVASNSAYIPRSTAMTYCASKAAVVMAMKCIARELASKYEPGRYPNVYTFSPGWLDGTPMSQQVLFRLPEGVKPHRIPGGKGINPKRLAEFIVSSLDSGSLYHGVDLRIDGGEQ